jgi:hypothetical protein
MTGRYEIAEHCGDTTTVIAWGLTREEASSELRTIAARYDAATRKARDVAGHPEFYPDPSDHRRPHLEWTGEQPGRWLAGLWLSWTEGDGSTSDDRGWTVREDGGVASHPVRPFRSHVRAASTR